MDVFGIPDSQIADVQTFSGTSGVTLGVWVPWVKPRGVSTIWMIAVGGGGGGGAGFTRTAGSAGGGGGGGGSGASAWSVQPAAFVPDSLFIQAGRGGLSTAAGIASIVAATPYTATTQQSTYLLANGGSAGGTGTGAAVGAAGTAGAVSAATDMRLGILMNHGFLAGVVGIAGGAVAGAVGGNTVAVTTGQRNMGGAGGAGCTTTDFAGGNQIATSLTQVITGAAGGAGVGGPSGIWLPNYGYSTGGAGGGSFNSGTAGAGGAGAYGGSGGGGGGAGTTGGAGGRGGDGYVMIISLR